MTKRTSIALAAVLLGSALSIGGVMAQAEKVVARVEGMEITEKDVEIAFEELSERMRGLPPPQRRDFAIGYLADLRLGARAAERAKLADSPDFARRMAYFRQKVLLDEYLMQEAKKQATPEAARKLFDETLKTMKPEEEVRARHILVEKEEEAKAALERVRKGEDFAKVAAELSRDSGSSKDGGDLGYFAQDRMVPQFGAMAFQLKVGEVSEPVQTQFGWHVIKVEDKRSKPLPKFEDVKDEIDNYLVRRAQQELVLALRKDVKVERLDAPKP